MSTSTIKKTQAFYSIIDIMKENRIDIAIWEKSHPNHKFTEISFSFPGYTELRTDKYNTITTLNKSQQDLAKEILQLWADVTNVKFIEKEANYDTDIKIGLYNNVFEHYDKYSFKIGGFSTYPAKEKYSTKEIFSISDYSESGQVWLNISETKYMKTVKKSHITPERKPKIDAFMKKSDGIKYYYIESEDEIDLFKNLNANSHLENNLEPSKKGTYKFYTYIHEIGHALGLPHTFNDNNNLDIKENSFQYSVMAYNMPKTEYADFHNNFPMSPMLIDIYLIQQLYGKNNSTRIGDTVYGFNSNSERKAYTLNTDNDVIISCIWDAGGNDTLDFSQYNVEQKIDLNEGTFSSIGGLKNNISIAFGTVIENALGGLKDNYILGNHVDNYLKGNQGNDTLSGEKGDDSLYGEQGDDILYGGDGDDTLYGNIGNDTLYGDDGDDLIFGEKGDDILFSGRGQDILYGGSGNDVLIAIEGDNILDGGYHDDTFIIKGGNNKLFGSQGMDNFIFYLESNTYNSHNIIYDFNKDEDAILFKSSEDKILINPLLTKELSDKNNEVKISYDNKKTTLKITNNDKLINKQLTIDIMGNFSYEDLFLNNV
ncbi:M10 family metallopeptidase C-terminal domain-containing protein [Proteus vulgaris]|uniref:M10 family metallopeptidase C-terminal domain-containing protein n=1 Tax=Proteus vulgaris TaxID=585 RepID=UPI0018E45557|nr:M10 family metallopeptidase C-terminal domain-containing protein [Proteus vulgaris]MBI6527567.1 M10 family metallopeptidase C-terminal domain-containing protein [Proteus vulgaris]